LAEPLSELEDRVLNDMYDAEVAYQDHYLGHLFNMLEHRERRRETLTVIVADHGDGLGDHGFIGHAFVAYQELVHVPLILHWPGQIPAGERIDAPVSTRRVFHTMLEAASQPVERLAPVGEVAAFDAQNARRLTLRQTINQRDPEQKTAFSEIYPPLNFVKAIESRQPELLTQFRCLSTRRAIVRPARPSSWGDPAPLKLIEVDETAEELYDLAADRVEMTNLMEEQPVIAAALEQTLAQMIQRATRARNARPESNPVDLESDELLQQRLRALGYLE
jgi:uncharacterized sulfatase